MNIFCTFMSQTSDCLEIHGTYDEGVTKEDIIKEFGAGHYHRFVFFDAGTFIYRKYIDAEELIE